MWCRSSDASHLTLQLPYRTQMQLKRSPDSVLADFLLTELKWRGSYSNADMICRHSQSSALESEYALPSKEGGQSDVVGFYHM